MLNERIRVDLHIHSNESWHKESVGLVSESDLQHIDVLMEKLAYYKINLISITDHNYLNAPLYHEIERIIQEGHHPSLKGIIAGVEFDVIMEDDEDPCHVMAYFDVKSPDQYDRIAQILEDNSKRSVDFAYSRNGFENVIYTIKLPTLLLAYQRRDPENNRGKTDKSFSMGVESYLSYLRTGYISGFDLQKPVVEGMIRNRLSDVESVGNIASLIASDCHQWAVYPLHDASRKERGEHKFSEYNALPTFRGLQMALTSPETRFNRTESMGRGIIDAIEIGDSVIELSPGINAIIGDNGSGKSTLLHIMAGREKPYQKNIATDNAIVVHGDGQKALLVEQAQLSKSYETNCDLEQEFNINYYPSVDGSNFRDAIGGYVRALRDRVQREISASQELLETPLPIKHPKDVYWVTVVQEEPDYPDESEVAERVSRLNTIVQKIDAELAMKSYSESQRERLAEARGLIDSVLREKRSEHVDTKAVSRAMSLVVEAGQNYEERMAKKRSSDDHATRQYDTLKARVANCVRDRAMAACAKASDYPLFPNLDHARAQGRGDKTMAGYRFVTYLPFLGMSDDEIKRELFTALFNRSVTADEDLREIHKEDDWVDCVRGTTNKDEVVNKLDENLTKFLGRMTKPLHEIQPLSKPDESIGSTLGERSIVFFKVISDQISRGDGALLIDQPEDNVSNYRIVSDLSPSLNGLRDRRQVIFVTHNPLLVVNLDVDNVIFVRGKRDMAGGIRNEIQVTSGCLEDEGNDILGIIARQMDGGRDAIQRRLNAYGDSA